LGTDAGMNAIPLSDDASRLAVSAGVRTQLSHIRRGQLRDQSGEKVCVAMLMKGRWLQDERG